MTTSKVGVSMPSKANVLLVDDQPANLLVLESILDGLGHNLVRANSGEEALELLANEDFAVVLLDIQMPGLDGFETAKMIRTRERSGHTPIIFLTGYDLNRMSVEDAYSLGVVDYLVKPLIPVILRTKVMVLVELFQKTERLRDLERREFERKLADEKTRLEEQLLRKHAEALEQADRRKDEFLAVLAHELRNPLGVVANVAQVVRLAGHNPRVIEQTWQLVERQVQQMTRLVDDLLEISRISRGKLDLRLEHMELSAVVTRAVEMSRPLIEAGGHELTVVLPQDGLWLKADPARLAQVLTNLLNNAAKYTERGGRIWLAAGRDGESVVLKVRDTGLGIPADLMPRLFDLFSQADRTRDRSQGGLGIGLSLVKRLVELHGGSVTARSEGPGEGSEFVVRLPFSA